MEGFTNHFFIYFLIRLVRLQTKILIAEFYVNAQCLNIRDKLVSCGLSEKQFGMEDIFLKLLCLSTFIFIIEILYHVKQCVSTLLTTKLH